MCPRSHTTTEGVQLQRQLSAWKAIQFADDKLEPWEVAEFVHDFRRGNLAPWPEFQDYVARRTIEGPA